MIGSVYLGELAIDKTEIEQWRQTIEHWGKECKGCHHLKVNCKNTSDIYESKMEYNDNKNNEYK